MRDRDGNKCVYCGAEKYINAHHIIGKRFEPLRFDLMNGISLCSRCHKFQVGIAAHENPIKFMLWLMENRPEQFEYLRRTEVCQI